MELIKKISLLLVFITLLEICFTSCKGVRVAQPICAGSSIVMYGDSKSTYKIKGTSLKSKDGEFIFDDYFVDENGTPYQITKGGKVVSTVKLSKKSEKYNPEVFEFNLDEYSEPGITITGDMNYVRIYSTDSSKVHDITIIVDYDRTSCCDVVFENVNIQTSEYISVLTNYSTYGLNIEFKGNNYFKSGTLENLEKYYEALTAYHYVNGVYQAVSPLSYGGWYFETKAVLVYLDTIKGKGTPYDNFNSASKEMTAMIKQGLQGLDTLLNNQKGLDGYDGMPTFNSIGSIYMYGSGSATIIGGDGTDGTNAYSGIIGSNNAIGGNGGDAGFAVVADVFIHHMEGNLSLRSGATGIGGKGSGPNAQNGSNGKVGFAYKSTYNYFFR